MVNPIGGALEGLLQIVEMRNRAAEMLAQVSNDVTADYLALYYGRRVDVREWNPRNPDSLGLSPLSLDRLHTLIDTLSKKKETLSADVDRAKAQLSEMRKVVDSLGTEQSQRWRSTASQSLTHQEDLLSCLRKTDEIRKALLNKAQELQSFIQCVENFYGCSFAEVVISRLSESGEKIITFQRMKEQLERDQSAAFQELLLEEEETETRKSTQKNAQKAPKTSPPTKDTPHPVLTQEGNHTPYRKQDLSLGKPKIVSSCPEEGRGRWKTVASPQRPRQSSTSFRVDDSKFLPVSERIERWHKLQRMNASDACRHIRTEFKDTTPNGDHRYQQMSDNQLISQVYRHSIAPLKILAAQSWFLTHYASAQSASGKYLACVSDSALGDEKMVLSFGIAGRKIYHAFMHPQGDLVSQGNIGLLNDDDLGTQSPPVRIETANSTSPTADIQFVVEESAIKAIFQDPWNTSGQDRTICFFPTRKTARKSTH